MKLSIEPILKIFKGFLASFTAILFLLLLGLGIKAPELALGQGKFLHWVEEFETFDFFWPAMIVIFFSIIFLITLLVGVLILEKFQDQIKQALKNFYSELAEKTIPVSVSINETIPVNMPSISAPFRVETLLSFDQAVQVKATIPIDLELPIDTIVETSVLGIGSLKIPIRTKMPVHLDFPFEGPVHMKVKDFPMKLEEMAQVDLPPMAVPVHCQVNAHLHMGANLEKLTKVIRY